MESTSGRSLSRDTVDTALRLLNRIQDKDSISSKERAAAKQLADWLAHIDISDSSDTDEALDESSRALLASFTDRYSRKRLANGLGNVIGGSPSLRASFYVKHQKLQGQEDLATELDKLDDWCEFDIFKVAALSNSRPLETVTLAILERFELVDKLHLDEAKLRSFLKAIEDAYSSSNPYHNSTHAADVTQSLGCLLTHDAFSGHLSDMELLSMIVAAAVHDVGHPGVSNEFLVNSSADLALEYNDTSVNENMHAAKAFQIFLMPHNNFLSHLSDSHYRFFRRTVISIVLATDMASHTELVSEFVANHKLLGPDLSSWHPEKRAQALQMCVHCADIANPAKPAKLSTQWTDRVQREFFSQGDKERDMGLPVSPLCDRERVEVAKSQLVFLERVVRPCYNALKLLAPNTAGLALQLVDEACQNWERLYAPPSQIKQKEELPCATQAKQSPREPSFPTLQPAIFPLEEV